VQEQACLECFPLGGGGGWTVATASCWFHWSPPRQGQLPFLSLLNTGHRLGSLLS
jgi:hypothetical protein